MQLLSFSERTLFYMICTLTAILKEGNLLFLNVSISLVGDFDLPRQVSSKGENGGDKGVIKKRRLKRSKFCLRWNTFCSFMIIFYPTFITFLNISLKNVAWGKPYFFPILTMFLSSPLKHFWGLRSVGSAWPEITSLFFTC